MKDREWAVIVVVVGFVLMLGIHAQYTHIRTKTFLHLPDNQSEICVELSGALKHPGTYICQAGISVKKLLENIPLAPQADRKKIPYNKILLSSQGLEIPKKKGRTKNSLEEK